MVEFFELLHEPSLRPGSTSRRGRTWWLFGRAGKNRELSTMRWGLVPLPVPAWLFWSVTIYDTETRSQSQTDQNKAALRSLFALRDNAARSRSTN
jgi:hypothetical protein